MQIRLATKQDSPAIKAIDSALGTDPNRAELIDLSVKRGEVHVALEGEKIVGYAIVNQTFFHRTTLEMLMVEETRRGQGTGRALLREAQDIAGKSSELWTSTNQSNHRMQTLLKSEGFEQTGKVDNLDPGDPELVYYKKW